MEVASINYEVRDGVACITLNRPDRLNAMTLDMLSELQQALRLAAAAPGIVRAVQITGAGRGFSSGHDLGSARKASPDDPREPLRDYYIPTFQLLRGLGIPTVAVVNGVCAGASIGLALACDIVIAARSAYFFPSFVNVGLVPDSGVSGLLTMIAGEARAAGMLLLAEKLPAEQAAAWGLIWKCVADEDLSSEAAAILGKLASGPTQTYRAVIQLLRSARANSLPEQMQAEAQLQACIRTTPDALEAKRAFLERRAPKFTGL